MSKSLLFTTGSLMLVLMAGGLLGVPAPNIPPTQVPSARSDTTDTSEVYTQRSPSRNGIGKVYMGREISKVMGHRGADWLERPAREKKERPDLLVDSLPLDPSDTVADIGAGTGYLSFRVAPRVPRGNVLAVDIQPEMLTMMRERIDERGVENVVPVRGTATDPQLPADSVDLAYMVDAYHEFSHPYEMMTALAEDLTPGGRVVLVEYPREDPSIPIKTLHKMTETQARKEMRAVGLEWVETKDMLPRQHFMVFRKPVE
ncbi:class I SAM-dependent methyltransferase [Salinibacter altiplanensis]|uniref:class I SAM-dependent methyltransferase n=1 Tax=Salinibacter altiplanensis TaxID=1803181 RepID=UPI000C9F9A66|nr:class I SAM-dependent methyltransferase [Salinibacter altiplanensis]